MSHIKEQFEKRASRKRYTNKVTILIHKNST